MRAISARFARRGPRAREHVREPRNGRGRGHGDLRSSLGFQATPDPLRLLLRRSSSAFVHVYDYGVRPFTRYRREIPAVVTEVFTLKYCDPHAVREEKVEASEVIQFAWEGTVREVDACAECFEEHQARFEPLVDYSRPVKKRRKKAAAQTSTAQSDSEQTDAEQPATADA